MGCVYLITSPSGKQYVGQTVQEPEVRWRSHVADAMMERDTSPAFHRAIRKYGPDAFRHEVLHEGITDQETLNRLEIEEIETRGSFAPNGYNMTAGGSFGPLCDEALNKIKLSWADPEKKRLRLHSIRLAFQDPEVRARHRNGVIAAQSKASYKQKLRNSVAERYEDPAERRAQAERTRRTWDDPIIRKRREDGQLAFKNDKARFEAANKSRKKAVSEARRKAVKNVFVLGSIYECVGAAAEGEGLRYDQVWDRVKSTKEKWRFWHYLPKHNDPECDAVEECWAILQWAKANPDHENVPEWVIDLEVKEMLAERRRAWQAQQRAREAV